jgi:rubrerythrin
MDRISSIQLAIENEATEMVFYQKQADRTRSPVAKALFQTLADEEKEHMARIRDLHDKLIKDGSWPEHVPIEVAGTNVKTVLKEARNAAAPDDQHTSDDLAALNKSLKFEQSGAEFYGKLAQSCDNPQEAKFFRFLSEIEREHMLSIKDSIFYLEDPEGWMQSQERGGLDGA